MSIILGDLNMGPGSSPGNYDFILTQGYVDAVKDSMLGKDAKREDVLDFDTWDPKNILNANGVHAHCAKDRIDHVFLLEDLLHRLSKRCLTALPSYLCLKGTLAGGSSKQL